jgi:uncharacterized protein (TIGR03663 family)
MAIKSDQSLYKLPSFTIHEKLFLLLIIVAGVFLRFYQLDLRAMHHDESLHLMYSFYILKNPDLGFYRYDPMLHGPLLYNIQSILFHLFGVSIYTLRILPAFLGSVFIIAPLFFRRQLSKQSILLLSAVVALSPTLVYWSRFLRHDFLVLTGMLVCILAIVVVRKKFKIIIFGFGLLLQCTAKENCYVTIALLLGYLIFEFLFTYLYSKLERHSVDNETTDFDHSDVQHSEDSSNAKCLIVSALRHMRAYWPYLIFSIILFGLVYAYLFTGGFRETGDPSGGFFERNFGAIIDGLYRKSVAYWKTQHDIVRIKGPFLFHFFVLSFYETLFIIAYFIHFIIFAKHAEKWIARSLIISLFAFLGTSIYFFNNPLTESPLMTLVLLENHADLLGLFFFTTHSVLLTTDHLLKNQRTLAFWGYFFTATLFTYSYLNEKVPWLSLYPFVFGLIYLTLFFDYHLRYRKAFPAHVNLEKILYAASILLGFMGLLFILESSQPSHTDYLILCSGLTLSLLAYFAARLGLLPEVSCFKLVTFVTILFLSRPMLLSNFVYPGHANELLSQVHTSSQIDRIARRIRIEINELNPGFKPDILATGESTWPLTAYFHGLPQFSFYLRKNSSEERYEYIFEDATSPQAAKRKGYHSQKIPLRSWWIPDYSRISAKKLLNYIWNHTPWNPTGSHNVHFSTKKNFYDENLNGSNSGR